VAGGTGGQGLVVHRGGQAQAQVNALFGARDVDPVFRKALMRQV
jgi:hypothetical protein